VAADKEIHETETAAAAAVYPSGGRQRDLLARFAEELKRGGVRVGGLVQEALFDADGGKTGLDIVELDSGRRIPINRPTASDLMHRECSLDASALVEGSGAIRRAVAERLDLVIVEKFGDEEQEGRGLADDILHAIAEGVPTIVAVPEHAVDTWARFTGGLAEPLAWEMDALRAWWRGVRGESKSRADGRIRDDEFAAKTRE